MEISFSLYLVSFRDIVGCMNKLLSFCILSIVVLGAGCTDDSITLDFTALNTGGDPIIVNESDYQSWTQVDATDPEMHFRQYIVDLDAKQEKISVLKFAPDTVSLQVAVDTTAPKTVNQWMEDLSATAVINASYFTEIYDLTTRTVVNDESHGPILSDSTGFVRSVGGDWEIITSDDSRTGVADYSIQSYPVLIDDGEVNVQTSSGKVAQRTVIANDADGYFYFIVAEYGVLTLSELSSVLVNSLDLNLDMALNLDGGTSTGIAIQGSDVEYNNVSVPVPSVVYVVNSNID